MQPKRYFRHLNNTFDGNIQGIQIVCVCVCVDCRRWLAGSRQCIVRFIYDMLTPATRLRRPRRCYKVTAIVMVIMAAAAAAHTLYTWEWEWKHTVAVAPAVIEAINYVSQIPNRVEYLRIICRFCVCVRRRAGRAASEWKWMKTEMKRRREKRSFIRQSVQSSMFTS